MGNNAYKIIKCNDSRYSCIVIPTSRRNPLENVSLLLSQLKEENIKAGRLLFDFIISVGNTEERYASIFFDSGFSNESFEYEKLGTNDPIRKESDDYLRSAKEYLNASALPKSQIVLLNAGYNI